MITLLTKLPWIAKALGFLKGKSRLLCEYGLIAAVVIIGSFTVGQWYSKNQIEVRLAHTEGALATVGSRLTLVEAVNEAHEQTIVSLRDLRERDAVALEGLLSDYRVLADRDNHIRKQLDELRQSNQTVQLYLDQPVPPELVRMLHDSRPGARNQNSDED